jgi:hypothetical protein
MNCKQTNRGHEGKVRQAKLLGGATMCAAQVPNGLRQLGQNEKPPFSGLCQLRPAAGIKPRRLMTG